MDDKYTAAARKAIDSYYTDIGGDPGESLETRLWHLMCGLDWLAKDEGFDLDAILADARANI